MLQKHQLGQWLVMVGVFGIPVSLALGAGAGVVVSAAVGCTLGGLVCLVTSLMLGTGHLLTPGAKDAKIDRVIMAGVCAALGGIAAFGGLGLHVVAGGTVLGVALLTILAVHWLMCSDTWWIPPWHSSQHNN